MGGMRAVILGMVLVLAGCANEKGIRVLSSGDEGPDEFAIMPSKELSAPSSYTSLPAPTPGGTNLADVDPLADGAAALGGKRTAAASGSSFPSTDSALVNYAARNGTTPNIREQLAQDDEAIRGQFNRFVSWRLGSNDRYNEIYRRYHLNAYRELARWRRAGVKTPTAPVPTE